MPPPQGKRSSPDGKGVANADAAVDEEDVYDLVIASSHHTVDMISFTWFAAAVLPQVQARLARWCQEGHNTTTRQMSRFCRNPNRIKVAVIGSAWPSFRWTNPGMAQGMSSHTVRSEASGNSSIVWFV